MVYAGIRGNIFLIFVSPAALYMPDLVTVPQRHAFPKMLSNSVWNSSNKTNQPHCFRS